VLFRSDANESTMAAISKGYWEITSLDDIILPDS
jgi:hypothetical protein